MEKSQAVDYTSIDYLEGLEADPQSVSAGSDILAEAARYHVDLDKIYRADGKYIYKQHSREAVAK